MTNSDFFFLKCVLLFRLFEQTGSVWTSDAQAELITLPAAPIHPAAPASRQRSRTLDQSLQVHSTSCFVLSETSTVNKSKCLRQLEQLVLFTSALTLH